jgi:endonuclease YncB( thermonuclease family)
VAGKSVEVDYDKYDRYQRVLGKVIVNGEDVNLEQVAAGMAWHYKLYQSEQSASDRIKYSDAELEARRHKVGLWRDPSPIPPWDYRQAERDRRKSMKPFVGKSTVW